MPFGVRNAPATFQRLVNQVIHGMCCCEAYLDDMVLYSRSWSDHLDLLRELFTRLQKASLTVNLSKCEFGKARVTYLGKVVGGGQVCPVNTKVEAVCAFPVPTTRRELRRFLGMAGYYRAFCKNFASVVTPLTNLLRPTRVFQWTAACQHAFDAAKALLANAPVLLAPDFEKPFSLAVDACDFGAGVVLMQVAEDGVDHPVSYFSKKCKSCQQRYATVEKEALAIQHFEIFRISTSHCLH